MHKIEHIPTYQFLLQSRFSQCSKSMKDIWKKVNEKSVGKWCPALWSQITTSFITISSREVALLTTALSVSMLALYIYQTSVNLYVHVDANLINNFLLKWNHVEKLRRNCYCIHILDPQNPKTHLALLPLASSISLYLCPLLIPWPPIPANGGKLSYYLCQLDVYIYIAEEKEKLIFPWHTSSSLKVDDTFICRHRHFLSFLVSQDCYFVDSKFSC